MAWDELQGGVLTVIFSQVLALISNAQSSLVTLVTAEPVYS